MEALLPPAIILIIMCGFAGFAYLNNKPFDQGADLEFLTQMGKAIHHRGPDQTSTLIWENIGLVFNRLSIVDHAGGKQPFETSDKTVSAVINGEIYNHCDLRQQLQHHQFQSQSDCEVLPYLYLDHDLKMFDDVNGMFAMALLDRRRRRLVLARDRLGIKPLFYCLLEKEQILLFASEMKALFAHPAVPRNFDWKAALSRLKTVDVRGHELPSFFSGIQRLPAGSILDVSISSGNIKQQLYWNLSDIPPDVSARPLNDYIDEYRELLTSSVEMRLMGDVELGTFLSGGIDSAAISSIAATKHTFPTFTAMSESTLGNGEVATARSVSSTLGLPNHQLFFDWKNLGVTPDDWRQILWHCEFYQINAEQLHKYYLHQFARETYPNLKVMLLGQGSDEFNGGYIQTLLGTGKHWDNDSWNKIDQNLNNRLILRQSQELGFSEEYSDLIQKKVIRPSFIKEQGCLVAPSHTWGLYTGFFRQNLDYHLWHEDRTAAAHSIENRVPFLDHRLIEFLASIPHQHHAALFTDKKILREATRGIVPDLVVDRPKIGFFYGRDESYTYQMMLDLITQNDGELIEQAIRGSEKTGGPFDPDKFRAHAFEVKNDDGKHFPTRLLHLVNMGVLADLATQPPALTSSPIPVTIREITEPELQKKVSLSNKTLTPDELENIVIALPKAHTLLEIHRTGSGPSRLGNYCISHKGRLNHIITPPSWGCFMSQVDGHKSVGSIITQMKLNRCDILQHLQKALDARQLLIVKSIKPKSS